MWLVLRRLWLALLLSLPSVIPLTNGLHESDVGVVDWHNRLIGVPLSGSSSTAPTFHCFNGTSLILTATVNNVLAALHPDDGSIAWRYIYDSEDRIAGFYKDDTTIATLSGPGGSTLRTFESLSGTLILEKRLHAPELGHLSEPHYLGKHVTFSPELDGIYVLSNGRTVTHVDNTTGEFRWTWTSPDHTSLTMYSKLVATPDAVYVVGLSKSFASYTLHITAFHPTTGVVLSTKAIPSSIMRPLNEVLVLSVSTAQNRQGQPHVQDPRVVWLEQKQLKSVPLTSTLDGKPTSLKGASFERMVDAGLCDHGHFVGIAADGTGQVIRIGGNGVEDVFKFEIAATSEDFSEPLYGGGFHKDGQVHISRAAWSHSFQKIKFDTVSSHIVEGAQAPAEAVVIPFDTLNHGIIEHAAIDTISPARTLITTSSGSLQLWQRGNLKWIREEGLANIVAAEFVELPEAEAVGGENEESFIGRIRRQVRDAQNFPHYLINFVRRFATGSYASATSPTIISTTSSDTAPMLTRDPFGFRQVIVAATMLGKVYGLDSADGSVLWSRVLGLGWAGEAGIGGTVHVVKIFVVGDLEGDGHGDKKASGPQVVLVAQRRAKNTLVDTVVFHVDALTGEDVSGVNRNETGSILQGIDIISGPMVEAYLLNHDSSKAILLLDEFLQVYLYPSKTSTQYLFKHLAPSLHFPLRTPNQIMGHQVVLRPGSSDQFVGYPTWTLSFPEGEAIKAMIKPRRGQVASIGKVLANQTTLYKYLNPRLFVLITESGAAAGVSTEPTGTGTETTKQVECGVYVVDAAKGTVVYRTAVPAVAGPGGVGVSCDVKVSLAENWLVYHYYDADFSGQGQTKGWRLVSVELYEGKGIDDKTMSSDMSSYSSKSTDVMAIEQAYVFPFAITAMAPTSTKFGITNKDLIVAIKTHQIQSVQRRLLNPRRPNRKVTAEEQEEFLVSYEPILAYDPRRVLSHNYEVANTQRIITAPALLESTSLVFAYGLDMFLTRVAPSNTFDVLSEDFNKMQLVFTISGLALAIMITKPMVRRKKQREKWYP